MKVCVAVVALLLVGLCAAEPWRHCGFPHDHFKVESVTVSPVSPSPGQPFTVTLGGSLDEKVTSGRAAFSLSYVGIKVFTHEYDLCAFGTVACPLEPGKQSVSATETLPSTAPKGIYEGVVRVKDQLGEEVTCVVFQMTTAFAMSDPVLSDEVIAAVNRAGHWKAARNAKFEGMTHREAQKLLGARNLLKRRSGEERRAAAPVGVDEFDARTKWPNCIHAIRDQGNCGSCWAFALTEVMSDRLCISSSGKENVVLAPQYPVSCDSADFGCEGGYLDKSWDFTVSTGVCAEQCWGYESGGGYVPPCRTTCKDGSAMKLYKTKAGSVQNPQDIDTMQKSLMANGPIEAGFIVYSDFYSYSSGVYRHVSGGQVGGHAVKCIGWGVEGGDPFWLMANSWGPGWASLGGFFKLLRGSDECEVEENMFFGLPA